MKKYKNILKNREDTVRKLIDILPMGKLKDENWKLVGVSNGGLKLASLIKGHLKNELNLLISEPIFTPNNPTCDVARVSETEEIVINEKLVDSFSIEYDYIYGEARRKHEQIILSKIYQYRKGKPFPSAKDEIVLLVDDGSESGATLVTALKTILSMKPKAVYIAVAVLPTDVLELLEPFADELFYIYAIDDFVETSLYYENLEEISEEIVEKLLED